MPNSSPNTVTITGVTGPGITNTAKTFTDVTNIAFDFLANTIRIVHGSEITYYSYAVTATVTYVIAAGHATITIAP